MPTGYSKRLVAQPDGSVRWDGSLEIDRAGARIVRRIFRLAATGLSPGAIGRRLSPPRSAASVAAIIRNRTYRGEVVRYGRAHAARYFREADALNGRQSLPIVVPPIIPDALWHAAQMAIRIPTPTRHSYPLTGLLRCSRCHRRLHGNATEGRRYYRCPRRDSPAIRAEVAERSLTGRIRILTARLTQGEQQ
jgi:hypothetical protein